MEKRRLYRISYPELTENKKMSSKNLATKFEKAAQESASAKVRSEEKEGEPSPRQGEERKR
jgi:hypothetical protein